jgi:TPR repeat protein
MGERNDAKGFAHWTKIAAALMENDGWQMTLLGDKFRQYGTSEQMAAGYALYEQAHALGSRTAAQRLLALASQPTSREYDAVKAASLYVELLGDATPDVMVKLLRRIDAEDAEIRMLALEQVSPKDVYLSAAEGGNPVAMREYARLVRADATGQQDVQTAVVWMERAAEQGDAPAMLDYAEMLAFGVGVPVSHTDAVLWLKRASDKGLEEANVMMQALNLAASQ